MEKYDYVLPEGFAERRTNAGYEYYDETGRPCVLYTGGYTAQAGDCTHYLMTTDQRRIPLQQVFRTPPLVGVQEAAEILGWDKRKVATYMSRGNFPEPVQRLAGGSIWTRQQILDYKSSIQSKEEK